MTVEAAREKLHHYAAERPEYRPVADGGGSWH